MLITLVSLKRSVYIINGILDPLPLGMYFFLWHSSFFHMFMHRCSSCHSSFLEHIFVFIYNGSTAHKHARVHVRENKRKELEEVINLFAIEDKMHSLRLSALLECLHLFYFILIRGSIVSLMHGNIAVPCFCCLDENIHLCSQYKLRLRV